MKSKLLVATIAAAALSVFAVGCSDDVMVGGSVNQGDKTVFPISAYDDSLSLLMGDVMPFYDDGVMNIYHLQNSRGTLSMYYHPISRLVTTDYVNYTDMGIALDFEERLTSPDAALGTGSFIKGKNGEYHCFYTGHNPDMGNFKDEFGAEIKDEFDNPVRIPTETIRHAVSYDNQNTWTKIEDFTLYGGCDDFRDPYVYYDADDGLYYMLITTRQDDCGVIKRYSAQSLDASADEWSDLGVFFKNDSGTFNLECPSYLEYNGYYYLMYSEQGDNRVTHYRYQTEKDGDWNKFERDYFDATGFYAGRPEKAGDKLYAFAWCAKLSGGSTGDFDWGGNLVVHELKQRSNGELCAVLSESVKKAFSTAVQYKTIDGDKISGFDFDGDEKFSAKCATALSDNVTRISFKANVGDYAGDFGITFGLDGGYNNRLGKCLISFDVKNSRISVYNDVSNVMRYGSALATMPFAFYSNDIYNVEILIDGEVFTVYMDGAIAVTGRCTEIAGNNFAFYSNGANVSIKEIKFYE